MKIFSRTPMVLKAFLLLFLIAGLLSACDNNAGNDKKFTVGIVNLAASLDPVIDGLKAGLAENGYTEGENITYIYEGSVASIDELDAAVQKLLDANVDVIFSLSTPATLSAKRLTAGTDIPVVFGTVTDPIAVGIVDNLIQHEGNITGVKTGGSEAKDLEWLHTIVPELHRVFILYNPNDASATSALADVRKAADLLDIEIVSVEASSPDAALAALEDVPEDIDGFLLLPDTIVNRQASAIVSFAMERKIPLAGINKEHVELGALLTFGSEHFPTGQQVANLVQQVLKGISPAELPIETAEFYLSINLQTANALGIAVDDATLKSAHTIIR